MRALSRSPAVEMLAAEVGAMCGAGTTEPVATGGAGRPSLGQQGRWHLRGQVLPGGELRDVWVVDGRLTFEEQPDVTTLAEDVWLLPGLVDAHAHLSLASPVEGSAEERATASALQQLAAGVLLVREPGSPDRGAVGLGPHVGTPRVLTAGRFLSPPGGYIPGLAREVTPDELAAAVAEQAAVSGAWVKVVADFFGEARIEPLWSSDDLRTAVTTAHAAGARLTVHATRPDVIAAAVEAGVDGVEHGTGMPRDLLPVLADRGVVWVPTMIIDQPVRAMAAQALPPQGATEVGTWLDTLPAAVAAGVAAGVTVLAGTDAGMGPHGLIAAEMACLLAAGVSPDIVLGAASWDARSHLGFPGIEQGAPADLLAVRADPRTDLGVLSEPVVTLLDGRLVT